jgi:hypothetical protein
MRTKKRGIKTCLVVVAVFISLLGIVSMAEAGDFANALLNLYNSSSNSAAALYFGMIALYMSNYDVDAQAYAYQAYSYMYTAASYSSTATNYAYSGYLANSTQWNYYAYQYTKSDRDYKQYARNSLYNAYYYNDLSYAPGAISNTFYADFYNGLALYFVGVACNGGSN